METNTSERNIVADIEYLENQSNYLTTYIQRIHSEYGNFNTSKIKWNGPLGEEPLFKEMDRWLKCYIQFKDHIKGKANYYEALGELSNQFQELVLKIPSTVKTDKLNWKGFKKFSYAIFPFYRIALNKKKIKDVKEQVDLFDSKVKLAKSIVLKLKQTFLNDQI